VTEIGDSIAAESGGEVEIISTNPDSTMKYDVAKMLLDQGAEVTTQQESEKELSGQFNCHASGLEQRGNNLVPAGTAEPAPIQEPVAPTQPAQGMSLSG
jgi:hypothetical protein